jgi:biotin carboxylase
MDIGTADSRAQHFDQDIVDSDFWNFDFLEPQSRLALGLNESFHNIHDNNIVQAARIVLSMQRLLLFAATTGYQIRVFADAARRLGVDLTLATDRCHIMDDPWGDQAIPVKFEKIAESLEVLRGRQFDGVAAVGDRPALLAAEAAAMLQMPFHPPAAARACQDKFAARQLYQAAGMRVPSFVRLPLGEDPEAFARRVSYPSVLKPLGLSASRGVIRANGEREFVEAFRRIRKIASNYLQVESYIPGREFAVEGLVTAGEFRPVAIFDKPDPLEGPFFEETIYVTPSREPDAVQQALVATTARAVRALGLWHGPVHAELRFNVDGAWMLETHARPIGGLCAKALRFAGGTPLEEAILRHALGEDVSCLQLEGPASGAMMIPIPKGGVYQSVDGLEQAAAIPGIEEIVITAKPGQTLIPLPEGASYLGFLFARGDSAYAVEQALRRSHGEMRFHIATALPTINPSL